VPGDVACDRKWLRVEGSILTAWEKSAEGIVVIFSRRPERFPGRGLKERRSQLLRNGGIASGELQGDLYWDETVVGETGQDAPVGVPTPPRPNLPNRRIRDPYVRW
jgi:hypothetical protein